MRVNISRVLSHAAGSLAEEMRNNREFVRTSSDRLKADLFAQGQERRNAQKKARLDMESAVDFLSNEGLEREKLLYLLSENPKELMTLAEIANKRKLDGSLSATALNNAVELSQNFEAPDMTPSELIRKATPDFVQAADVEMPEDKRNLVQRLFTRPGMDVIAGDVYASEIMPGVTGADIVSSMQAAAIEGKKGPRSGRIDYGSLQPVDDRLILDLQNDLIAEYDSLLTREYNKLVSLPPEERAANQSRIRDLSTTQDIGGKKERLAKMIELLGPSLAQDYFTSSPEIFVNQPGFISTETIETYLTPSDEELPGNGDGNGDGNGNGNGNGEGDQPETPEVEFSIVTVEEGEDPKRAAQDWFRNNTPRPDVDSDKMVAIQTPDGIKYYKYVNKRGSGTGAMIIVEEVQLSTEE